MKEKIKIEKINYNGVDSSESYNGVSEEQALRDIYVDQGGLYLALFGVEKADALAAGWAPEDKEFRTAWSSGWKKFLEEKGRIVKTIRTEEILLKDFILAKMR
jgi:hypothetical protein